jgi:hypothetical protein
MPSEPVVEALVCAAEAAVEPVVRALVVWLLSPLALLEEPVAKGSFRAEVTDAKSMPADENAADTLERAAGSNVERACWRDVTAAEADASMSLSEPSADASETADDAAASAADWIDGASVASSDGARLAKEERSSSWAVAQATMPAMMAVEKRMLSDV